MTTPPTQRPRPTPPAVAAGYQQPEAFNLMYYQNEATGLGLLIYNPQDFVTPFCVHVAGQEYRHTWWGLDRFLPGFTVQPGMHYFRKLTEAEARDLAGRRLDQFAGTEFEVPAAEREQTLSRLATSFLDTPTLDRKPLPDGR